MSGSRHHLGRQFANVMECDRSSSPNLVEECGGALAAIRESSVLGSARGPLRSHPSGGRERPAEM